MAFLLLLTPVSCKPSPDRSKEKEAVEQLSSEDWSVREKSIFALSDIEIRDYNFDKRTQKELLSLIKNEVQTYDNYKDRLKREGKSNDQISDELYKRYPPQTYGDYIKALVFFAASKKIDNALPSIFELIVDTDYNVSPAILTLYGTKYLDFFVEKATKGNDKEREMAMSVLAIWVNPTIESDDFDMNSMPRLNQSEVVRVKPIFLKAADDNNNSIRDLSLFGLNAFINEPGVRELVSKIAASDNDQYIRENAGRLLRQNR